MAYLSHYVSPEMNQNEPWTSLQVDGGTSPQWAEMQLLNRQDISSVSLHGLGSDQLHLHISALPPSTAEDEGHSASSGSDAEPSQDSEPGRGRHIGAAPEAKQGSDSQQHYSSRDKGPAAPPENKHAHADGDSFPNGTTDSKWRRSGSLPSSEHGSKAEKDAQSHVSKVHPVPCQRGPPSCKLILAADIALNDLERLPDILGSLRCSKPALDGPDSLIAWQQHSLIMPKHPSHVFLCKERFPQTSCCLHPSRSVLAQDNCKHPDNHCHAAADLDNRVLPANTLILELTDGLYIWPPSSHIQRTASGAVPSSIPEPALILDGEACTSHQERHIE